MKYIHLHCCNNSIYHIYYSTLQPTYLTWFFSWHLLHIAHLSLCYCLMFDLTPSPGWDRGGAGGVRMGVRVGVMVVGVVKTQPGCILSWRPTSTGYHCHLEYVELHGCFWYYHDNGAEAGVVVVVGGIWWNVRSVLYLLPPRRSLSSVLISHSLCLSLSLFRLFLSVSVSWGLLHLTECLALCRSLCLSLTSIQRAPFGWET